MTRLKYKNPVEICGNLLKLIEAYCLKAKAVNLHKLQSISINFNRAFIICILSLSSQLCFGVYSYSFAQDRIIAIVNNECLTQKDLDDFLNFTRMQMDQEYSRQETKEKLESLKVDLLDKLIDDRLILQEARKNKVDIDESRIKAKIAGIKRQYPSEAEFQSDLARQGLVQADIEKKIREQLLMYVIIDDKVRSKIIVNPAEVTDFYTNNLKDFIIKEEREVTSITLESLDLAKSFVYDLRSAGKIEDLSTRYSLVVTVIKAAKDGTLRKDIEKIIFSLSLGGISDPVKIDDKYYVFRLEGINGQRQQSLSEVEDKIFAFLMEKKAQEKFADWLNEIKKQAYITIK
jgi:parvulin-like peptidyl-prolyl isomerase